MNENDLRAVIQSEYDKRPPSQYPTELTLARAILKSEWFTKVKAVVHGRSWNDGFQAGIKALPTLCDQVFLEMKADELADYDYKTLVAFRALIKHRLETKVKND